MPFSARAVATVKVVAGAWFQLSFGKIGELATRSNAVMPSDAVGVCQPPGLGDRPELQVPWSELPQWEPVDLVGGLGAPSDFGRWVLDFGVAGLGGAGLEEWEAQQISVRQMRPLRVGFEQFVGMLEQTYSDSMGPEQSSGQSHTTIAQGTDLPEISQVKGLKAILQPRAFDGKPESFAQFRRDLENFFLPYRLGPCLKHATQDLEEPSLTTMGPKLVEWSQVLYAVLVSLTREAGTATLIVDSVQDANGFAAWRRLVREFQPLEADRQIAIQAGLLNPEWTEEDWSNQYLAWKTGVAKLAHDTGRFLDDATKIATVLRCAPEPIRQFLELVPRHVTSSFSQLDQAIEDYLTRQRTYHVKDGSRRQFGFSHSSHSSEGTSTTRGVDLAAEQAPVPMDVAALQVRGSVQLPKGRPAGRKGFGRGRGASSVIPLQVSQGSSSKDQDQSDLDGSEDVFDGTCDFCGLYGHRQRQCAHYQTHRARVQAALKNQGVQSKTAQPVARSVTELSDEDLTDIEQELYAQLNAVRSARASSD